MNGADLRKELKSGKYKNFYVLQGEEEFLKRKALINLISTLIPEELQSININQLEKPDTQNIIESAQTIPFIGDKRMIIVYDSPLLVKSNNKQFSSSKKQSNKKDDNNDAKRLNEFLENIPSVSYIVFYCHGKIDSRKTVSKYLLKKKATVNFDLLNNYQSSLWITHTARQLNKKIDNETAQQLLFIAGNDTSILFNEINKVVDYIGEKENIEMHDIEKIVTHSANFSVFKMTDAITSGDIKTAINIYSYLMNNGENEYMLLAMIMRECRIIYYFKCLILEKAESADYIKNLGILPFAVDKYNKKLKKFTKETLFKAYSYCINTDFLLKSGRISQEGLVERTIINLYSILFEKQFSQE